MGIHEIVFCCFIVLALCRISTTKNDEKPAIFIFGDSLLDVGNNNYIATLAKTNYLPYGIDFGGGPTGRCTNGRITVDIIGQEQGIGFIPPYLPTTTNGSMVLKGVNYASAGAGILNLTGYVFGGRINFDAQIDNFANTKEQIIKTIGVPMSLNLFKNAIFVIVLGSNDFLGNYFTPILSIPERKLIPPNVFVASILSKFRVQLTRLFNLGARKVMVANVAPIGCTPYMKNMNSLPKDECATFPNQMVQLYNTQLKILVDELRTNLKGSIFVYADTYHIVEDLVKNYREYGFENSNSACCRQASQLGGLLALCTSNSEVCEDRSKYIFWDIFHPSDAANVIIANRLLHGDENDISPINMGQLFQA